MFRTSRCLILVGLVAILASGSAGAQNIGDLLARLPFERHIATDAWGREVTFYLSRHDAAPSLPLAVFVQGSGCESLFQRVGDQVGGGLQNLLLSAASGQARVLAVEKPGVALWDRTAQPGAATECSEAFRREHTLDRWAGAIAAAIEAAHALPHVDAGRTLVVGHSEGGLVAARVAAELDAVTHVASLAGGGPTQLHDLAEAARRAALTPEAAQQAADTVYATWAAIQADPEAVDAFEWGHPHRRWSSFLSTSVLRELERSDARVFLAQGADDPAVVVSGFDVLRAELAVRGRDVTARRVDGAGHTFADERGGVAGFQDLLVSVVDWFLAAAPTGG